MDIGGSLAYIPSAWAPKATSALNTQQSQPVPITPTATADESANPSISSPTSQNPLAASDTATDLREDAKERQQRQAYEQVIAQLQARDREVRAHEQAHLSAAGPYATGGIQYDYQTGPDGQLYAVGGSVGIDTSPIPGDPEATMQKMQVVQRAALAPAEPSGQDIKVAAQAAQQAAQARIELQNESTQQVSEDDTSLNERNLFEARLLLQSS
ncbi:putative metalloprotease CJM1_0395 family protein [Thiomicrospira sp. ALE5]|uniref:putative metalloprotease CJM1_0395 family protein n=1 Tax=Thiomicrospira sp. ALE5 TaxID=748650 RepID=UPI0008EAF22B|nr:putative metalloprotease CJM1_0395 family protein [Thiomicrospira sp. ALE5]SFR52509.1 SprA-related family protein [Thiomicrospira sp. ALE5]